MKGSSWIVMGAALSLGLGGAARASAQDLEVLRTYVPFAFQVGSAHLPQGHYVIHLDEGHMPGVLRIRSTNGREVAFELSEPVDVAKSATTPEVVFDRVGRRYVLAEVVDPGNDFAAKTTYPEGPVPAKGHLVASVPPSASNAG
jgi:hypothetical protein